MRTRLMLFSISVRNLVENPIRSSISVLMVTLGVATTIAADGASEAIIQSLANSPDAQTFMLGLLDQFDRLMLMTGMTITVFAGFLILNSFSISVTQRRRQTGMLRLLGATRSQMLVLVLGEAALIGALGVFAGVLAGPWLGEAAILLIQGFLGEAVFSFQESPVPPSTFVIAGGLGMGITLLAVLLPARRATRVPPLVALFIKEPSGIVSNPTSHARLGLFVGGLLLLLLAVTSPGAWIPSPLAGPLTIASVMIWLISLGFILPALIGAVGIHLRPLLSRFRPANGRLIADNLQRNRSRVTLNALSIALALALIGALSGFFRFAWVELFSPRIESAMRLEAWLLTPFNIAEGMDAYRDLESIRLSPEVVKDVGVLIADRAQDMEWHFVIVPELSFFGSSYFSFLVDPQGLQKSGEAFFEFSDGDWKFAAPVMESGCGVLMAPLVAERNGLARGDTFTVTGAQGPVACRVAGIGSPYVGASMISQAAGRDFGVTIGEDQPIALLVWPFPGTDRNLLGAELEALAGRHPPVQVTALETITALQTQVLDNLPKMINTLLLLAIFAATLGVVNTTMLSVVERRRELSLYYALGATRTQTRNLVVGEAALMGLVGGGLGIVAGVGIVLILVVTYGGRSWGIPDLDLWGAAWRSVQPALTNGLFGLLAAPFISAAGAWIAWSSLTRGDRFSTIELRRH